MNNINNIYILNIIINNLIPQTCRTNLKKEQNIELNKIIENIIKLWSTSSYNINSIISVFDEKIKNKEVLYLNSIDNYVPYLYYENILKDNYKSEVINILNIETEYINEIYDKLNKTNLFNDNDFNSIKILFNKYKDNKIFYGINDNNYNCFYLLSLETPTSIINNNWIFNLNKPYYKLNIYMVLIIKLN